MPIPFTCPRCGHHTIVADKYAGETGPCASCGKTITVPAPPPEPGPAAAGRGKQGAGIAIVVVAVVLCGGLLMAVLAGLFVSRTVGTIGGGNRARMQCASHLRQIGAAMMAYHQQHQCYPPAYLADDDGKPMHSWRVLILPHLGEQGKALYDLYDFEQPWDSEHNQRLLNQMPSEYGCPENYWLEAGHTSYVVISGEGLLFNGDKKCRSVDVLDGPANTLMVVETAGAGVNWLEPTDLDGLRIAYSVDSGVDGEMGSNHPTGINVLMADGSVRQLYIGYPEEDVQAMATIDGGEEIYSDE